MYYFIIIIDILKDCYHIFFISPLPDTSKNYQIKKKKKKIQNKANSLKNVVVYSVSEYFARLFSSEFKINFLESFRIEPRMKLH